MDAARYAPANHAWQVLHPPVQPYAQGWLDVGQGHHIHWEQSGHPGAPVALFLHGGPGIGCTSEDRRWFNPQHWRTVLLDQRGCGQSRAADPLHANTTAHLVTDLDVLRQHLGIDAWTLFGGSWGSTLALAYAQTHPQRVSGLVLRGVFLGSPDESRWLYGDNETAARAALHHPQAWQRLCQSAGCALGQPLLAAAHARLLANDEDAGAVAQAWWRWEDELMGAERPPQRPPRQPKHPHPHFLRAARISVHYARAGWFLPEGGLLAQAHRLAGLPGVIVQGHQDLITPPPAAHALQAAWPGAQLHLVPGAGHASSHPALASALINATEHMATRLQPRPALAHP
jgi:proline iminopeptidase